MKKVNEKNRMFRISTSVNLPVVPNITLHCHISTLSFYRLACTVLFGTRPEILSRKPVPRHAPSAGQVFFVVVVLVVSVRRGEKSLFFTTFCFECLFT